MPNEYKETILWEYAVGYNDSVVAEIRGKVVVENQWPDYYKGIIEMEVHSYYTYLPGKNVLQVESELFTRSHAKLRAEEWVSKRKNVYLKEEKI